MRLTKQLQRRRNFFLHLTAFLVHHRKKYAEGSLRELEPRFILASPFGTSRTRGVITRKSHKERGHTVFARHIAMSSKKIFKLLGMVSKKYLIIMLLLLLHLLQKMLIYDLDVFPRFLWRCGALNCFVVTTDYQSIVVHVSSS